jgi:soluble lytic murein transglycosylase-like protein
VHGNKKVYICFVVLAMLAASPMRAADSAVPASQVSTPESQAIVVRVDPRTGKLVRKTIVPADNAAKSSRQPKAALAKPPAPHRAQFDRMIELAARTHDVDPLLVHSVVKAESNYNPYAVSSKGAEGLMQLMPGTARMLGVENSFDPNQNIEAGVKYLKYLKSVYKDDRLALAAYNAGPGTVDKYKLDKSKFVPPYSETRNYVEQVSRDYEERRAAMHADTQVDARPVESALPVIAAPTTEPKHPKLEQYVDEYGRLHLRTQE